MEAHRDVLERLYGGDLSWESLEDRKACRIRAYRPAGGEISQEADHGAIANWFMETMERFREATQHVRHLLEEA